MKAGACRTSATLLRRNTWIDAIRCRLGRCGRTCSTPWTSRRKPIPHAQSPSSIHFRPAALPTWSGARWPRCSSRSSSSPSSSTPKPAQPARSARKSPPAPSRTATRCSSHLTSISGFRRGRQAVRPHAEIHPRRLHPARALRRRSLRARRQRPAAVQDAEGVDRRRQEASGRDPLLVVRPLRRAAHSDGAVHEGRRRSEIPPSADQRRWPGADGCARQQFAGAGVVDLGGDRQIKAGKAAAARYVRRQARRVAARRADDEGAWLRRRILSLGRRIRPEGHAEPSRHQAARRDSTRPRTPTSSRPR